MTVGVPLEAVIFVVSIITLLIGFLIGIAAASTGGKS